MYFTFYSTSPLPSQSSPSRREYEPLVSAGDPPPPRRHAKQFSFASLPLPVTQLAPSGFANLAFAPSVSLLLALVCCTLLSVRDTTVFHGVPPESILVLTSLCLLLPSARAIQRYVSAQVQGRPSSTSRSSTQFIHYGFTSMALALSLYALLSSAPVMPVSISATVLSLSAVFALVLVTLLSSAVPLMFPVTPSLFLLPSALLVLLSMPSLAVSSIPTVLLSTACLAMFLVMSATASRTVNYDALPSCVGIALFALSLVFADGTAIKSCFSFSALLSAGILAITINFACRNAAVRNTPLLIPTTLAAAAPLTAAAAWPLFQETPSIVAILGLAAHACAAVALAHALKRRCDQGDKDGMLCGLDVSEKVFEKLGLVGGGGHEQARVVKV